MVDTDQFELFLKGSSLTKVLKKPGYLKSLGIVHFYRTSRNYPGSIF